MPIIGFPRGAGLNYERYAAETGVDAVGLDTTVPLGFAGKLQSLVVVQGNLDPVALVVGGKPLTEAVANCATRLPVGPLSSTLDMAFCRPRRRNMSRNWRGC